MREPTDTPDRSDKPTMPIPRTIAPRPDDVLVRERLDAMAHEVYRLVIRHGGNADSEQLALDTAHKLRAIGDALGLPNADTIASGVLHDRGTGGSPR